MAAEHSKFSASKAHQWIGCPGSIPLTAGTPRRASRAAAHGTAAHQLLEWVLQERFADGGDPIYSAQAFLGRVIKADGYEFDVDDEMVAYIDDVADEIGLNLNAPGSMRFTEQRVNYAPLIGAPEGEAFGTSDVIGMTFGDAPDGGDTLHVYDLKYGYGRVWADRNVQLYCYGLGALHEYGFYGNFTQVRLGILQPRVANNGDYYECSIDELRIFAEKCRDIHVPAVLKAERLHAEGNLEELSRYLNPSDKACEWCAAKATCPAIRGTVLDTLTTAPAVIDDFADLDAPAMPDPKRLRSDDLGAIMDKVDLVETFIKGVQAEVERRLLAGEEVPGWKLVEGKRGNRAWVDPVKAEATLKVALGDDAYTRKLASPAAVEKAAKARRTTVKLEGPLAVAQAPGKPHVAPAADPRPQITGTLSPDEFEVLSDDPPAALNVHPFRS